MKLIRPALFYLILCLNVLLVFLSFYADEIYLPALLTRAGRLHPLLLHFPLALILVSFTLYFTRRQTGITQTETFDILFFLSALTAVLSALFGLFLSVDGDYDDGLLSRHHWLGVAVSLLGMLVLYLFRLRGQGVALNLVMIITVPLLIIGSHFGGVLTHGEDFLSPPQPLAEKQVVITDSSRVFDAFVEPILATKCYSCHNEKKAKGELIMTTLAELMKGGKNGPLWVAGDPLNSHIMERMELSVDDKKHMPPRGKPQLSDREKLLIQEWIRQGADTEKRIADYPVSDSFRLFFTSYIPKTESNGSYDFSPADPDIIASVNSPFCDVTPIATGSPALQARFLIRAGYDAKLINSLEKVARQLVYINLGNMPVRDEDLRPMARFTNLEVLNLNGTDIKGIGLLHLQPLELQSLSLSNTKVDEKGFLELAKSLRVKNVYCWNTVVDSSLLAKLESLNPEIRWHLGFVPDKNDLLKMTPPQLPEDQKFILGDGDSIRFKHPMQGVNIRYTIDGSAPDSLHSPLYTKPFTVDRPTKVRAIAVRQGWLASDTLELTIFKLSIKPDFVKLLKPPDKNYKANEEASLFDGLKGDMISLKENWIGVQQNDLVVMVGFRDPVKINNVIISALKKTGPYIMPPQQIDVYAGNDSLHLKKIAGLTPVQPKRYEADKIEIHDVTVNGTYRYFRIHISNVKALPRWHEGKGKPGWAFVDEIFFN